MEHFIRQQRDAFDNAPAPPQVWEAISRQLDRWDAVAREEHFIALHRPLLDTEVPRACVWTRLQVPAPVEDVETFIQQHRSAFDGQRPHPRVWAGIAQRLPKSGAKRLFDTPWVRAAAAAALLLMSMGTGLWLGIEHRQRLLTPRSLSDISSEYAELEQYFQREIQYRKNRLAQVTAYSSPATVLEDLRQIDLAMAELQAELAQVPPAKREPIVQAMIENYKTRLAILERVLEYLEGQNNQTTHSPPYDDTEI